MPDALFLLITNRRTVRYSRPSQISAAEEHGFSRSRPIHVTAGVFVLIAASHPRFSFERVGSPNTLDMRCYFGMFVHRVLSMNIGKLPLFVSKVDIPELCFPFFVRFLEASPWLLTSLREDINQVRCLH